MAKRQAGKTTNGESFVFVDSEELPESYHQTQLTLIVRDPYWLHAYWEITPDAIQNVAQEIGYEARQCAYVLRMYDVTLKDFDGTNANHWFDIEVGSEANSWYVNLWNDKVAYCGDIGLRAPDGRFFTLARSNAVQTQRANFSPRSEVIWMEVAGEEVNPPYVMAKGLLANVLENRQIQGPREKENI
ncbi:MAG: DUF4912 domain-containing protein, partial [Candidatus Omnitrophica bacterium]|nr:DUF4912 domain-containing protein [Candidatus Omnitrophota bacterium]